MRQLLKILLIVAGLGLGAFFFTAWKVTTVHAVDATAAGARFRTAYEGFEDTDPMLTRDAAGQVIRHQRSSKSLVPAVPHEFVVLAWRGPEAGLVEMRIPLWFLRMKGAALQHIFRRTGMDPAPWNFDVEEIQAWGPGIVIDHRGRSERVLVWAE